MIRTRDERARVGVSGGAARRTRLRGGDGRGCWTRREAKRTNSPRRPVQPAAIVRPEPVVPKPELLIVGHGRIAETLATFGTLMNFFVIVSDPAADKESFPQADRLICEDFDLTETPIGPRTHVVIATLHKSDHIWLQKALESDAAYVALIASTHRAKLVLDYLLLEGVPAEKVEKVWAPAGLDLGAATPEEIALSIISQIMLFRRRGTARLLEQTSVATDKVIRQCEVEE